MSPDSSEHGTCSRHSRYALSCSEWDDILLTSAGTCQCCGERPGNAIDHDHRYGPAAVRGYVCHTCNVRLTRVDMGSAGSSPPSPCRRT